MKNRKHPVARSALVFAKSASTGLSDDFVGTELLFANDRIRVWALILEPGQASTVHRHRNDYVFIYDAPSRLELTTADGPVSVETCKEGFVQYREIGESGIASHQIRNIGKGTHREIIVEFLGESKSPVIQVPENNGRFGEA